MDEAHEAIDSHVSASAPHAGHATDQELVDGLAGKLDLLNLLGLSKSEVAVSGATALTANAFGRMHALAGMGYTLTLPDPAGHAGEVVGIRVGTTATGLYTIAGSDIDGAASRAMWAQETALLMSTGSGWRKVAGRTRPMSCGMRIQSATANQAQSIAHNTVTKILLNQTDYDDGGLADLANNRMTIRRAGRYTIAINIYYSPSGATIAAVPRVLGSAIRLSDGSTALQAEDNVSSLASYPGVTISEAAQLAAGENLEYRTFQNSGEARWLQGSPTLAATSLKVTEAPSW